ncbi:AbrB/MazE/SpoVT family DNA-binding domain-containing protein [bacterium]|nr:AbrB/MazE/SpoVT family DNA-binding domain-containing protein [bacterium]
MPGTQRVKELKIVQIGNSKGIRLPKSLIDKYGFEDLLQVEETENGIFLKNKKDDKMSWEETFKEMKAEKEDWSDFDDSINDGLEGDEFED